MTTVTTKKTEIPKTTTKFIEIVNWQKAQSMTMSDAPWLKLYTSILDNDRIDLLDDASYRLLNGLWALAARMGTHIFPANPGWLMRRIPFLKKEPDLTPLLEAKDMYGRAAPFIRYCKPPAEVTEEEGKSKRTTKKKTAKKTNKKSTTKKEESREEQSREEKRREDETLTDFGREERDLKKTGLNSVSEKEQKKTEQNPSRAQTEQNTAEHIPTSQNRPQNPSNPMESEVTAVKAHHVPKQPSSALRGGDPQHIGRIISDRFPAHWQDPDAKAFGWEIVEALGISTDRENQQSRAEWGAFASWWSRLKQVVPSVVYEELRAVAIAKAEYVRIKGKSARNKSAVWFGIVSGILSSRDISLPPARASPKVSIFSFRCKAM